MQKPKKKIQMRSCHSANDVRHLLRRLINARLQAADEIDNATLRALNGTCSCALKSIELSVIHDQIAAIQAKLDKFEKERGTV